MLTRPDGRDKTNEYRLYPESGLIFKANEDYLVAHYAGGIDGEGLLARIPKTGPTRTYCKALVPQAPMTQRTNLETRALARVIAPVGRVSVNHAIEHVVPDTWEPELRFLYRDSADDDRRFLLPLPILGGPKPSAVEHYLDQTGVEKISGATRTYGDLPGIEAESVYSLRIGFEPYAGTITAALHTRPRGPVNRTSPLFTLTTLRFAALTPRNDANTASQPAIRE